MASFDITAQINLRGPTNVKKIAADIRRQLSTVTTGSVKLNIDPKTNQQVNQLNKSFQQFNNTLKQTNTTAKQAAASLNQLGSAVNTVNTNARATTNALNQVQTANQKVATSTKQVAQNAQAAATGFDKLGKNIGRRITDFLAFRAVSTVIGGLSSAISQAAGNFIDFERALAKVQQVTGGTNASIQVLSNTINNAAVATGSAAKELAEVTVTLSQAGLSADDTATALEALAQTKLAPTFGDIKDTAEGAIAILRQFGLEADQLGDALGSINAVAGQFAVSSSDVIVAVKQAGAVFASSSRGVVDAETALQQFIATFTSVRQTTRESAETIGTGLKTIITRLQRLDTIESLKNFGIELTDLEGKFVGPFEAIKRLNEGLKNLDTRDIRFGAIIEELGGFRQVGKVIPLIQQFAVAQEALKVAQEGQGSISDQAVIAQKTLGFEVAQTAAQFQKLITTIGNSSAIQGTVRVVLELAQALLSVADALSDILPLLLAVGTNAAIASIASVGKGIGKSFGFNQGGVVPKGYASGGYVPGSGNRDTVPAMLTPGEFVIRKKAVQAIGVDKLGAMNQGGASTVTQAKHMGGRIQKFATGGQVAVDYVQSKPDAATEKQLIGNNIINSINNLANFFSPEAKNVSERADPKNVVPNYSGMVGGIFEKAVELVAGVTVPKSKNNQVWDYPAGLGDTELFNYVPSLNRPTDAKNSVNSNAVIDKKLQAHYNNAKGSEKLRTKFGIVVFDEGVDYDYTFDPSYFKERALDKDSVKKARGGLIQNFVDGGEAIPIAKSGRIKKKDLADATTPQLEQLLKNPAVISNPSTTQAINSELAKRGKEAKAEKLGVVGILPINYAKDLAPADYGGTFAKIYARGLPQKYEETVLNISKGLRGVVDEAARGLGEDNPQALSPEQEKATGLENVQGTVFEAVLSALGARGGSVQNQAIDYQNGLGPAARIFPGIGPDWPTEVKRDVTGAGMSRAKGEFARYFKENAQNKSIGGAIQRFATGGRVNDKAGLKIKTTGGSTITSTFEEGQTSSGEVVAQNIGKNLFSVVAAQASGGGGRALYDAAMKQATRQGGSLVSDRSRVSSSALNRIWNTYYGTGKSKTGQRVGRQPVPEDMLYTGAFFKDSDFPSPDPSTWQGKAVSLQYAYQQFADGGAASGGDTVPAMLTPGEYVINKKAAKQIGLPKLNQMNYADRIKGYATGGPVGPVQYFNNGGSPASGSAPASNPWVTAAKINLTAAKLNQKNATTNSKTAATNGQAANTTSNSVNNIPKEMGIGARLAFGLIGPLIEQAIVKIAPNSAIAAGAGEGISQGIVASSTSKELLGGLSGAAKLAAGRFGKFGKLLVTSGKFLEKWTGTITTGIGLFAGFNGFLSGQLNKSIELLALRTTEAGKAAEEAFAGLPGVIAKIGTNAEDYNAILSDGGAKLADMITAAEAQRQKSQQKNQGGYFGAAFRGLGLESEEGREIREAQGRDIDREAFRAAGDLATKQLLAIVSSGDSVEEAFGGNKVALDSFKRAIALTDLAYQKEERRLQDLINKAGAQSAAGQAYTEELRKAREDAFKKRAADVDAAIASQKLKKEIEEQRKALNLATVAIANYTIAYNKGADQAAFAFKKLAKSADRMAEGLSGTDPSQLFADNINVIQNPELFNQTDNTLALEPLKNILGGNRDAIQAFTTLPAEIAGALQRAVNQNPENNAQGAAIIQGEIDQVLADKFGSNSLFARTLSNSIKGLIAEAQGNQDGEFNAAALIKGTTEIIEKFGEDVKKGLVKSLETIQEAFGKLAQSSARLFQAQNNYANAVRNSVTSQLKLNQEIKEALSEVRQPRSISSINDTSGVSQQQVSNAGDYFQQLAIIQQEQTRLNVEQVRLTQEGIDKDGENATEIATAIGANEAALANLNANTKNLQAALQDKLGQLQSELGSRLADLKAEQAAAESIFESLLKDEGDTNQGISRALQVASGQGVGNLTGDEAIRVLKDIKQLQAAGIIENNKETRENVVGVLGESRGLGNFTGLGQEIIDKIINAPGEDDQVKAYVAEIQRTNIAINQLTSALAFTEFSNASKALNISQDALRVSITTLNDTIKSEIGKIKANGGQDVEGITNEPETKAKGGLIYRSSGGGTQKGVNWQPRGTDTIPAMLTPGEFVVNAKATSQNRGLLESINRSSGGPVSPARKSTGGILYRNAGGGTDSSSTESVGSILDGLNAKQILNLLKEADFMKEGGALNSIRDWTSNTASAVKSAITKRASGVYGGFKNFGKIKIPTWMDDAVKNGLLSEDVVAGLADKPYAVTKFLRGKIDSLTAGPVAQRIGQFTGGAYKFASNKLGLLAQSKWIKNILGPAKSVLKYIPKLGSFLGNSPASSLASKGLAWAGLVEHMISGAYAGVNRSQDLQDSGVSPLSFQGIMSPLAEFLAGGTADGALPPNATKEQKAAWMEGTKNGKIPRYNSASFQAWGTASLSNLLRMVGGMGTGFTLAAQYAPAAMPYSGMIGAAVGGGIVVAGQTFRTLEEIAGLWGDQPDLAQTRRQEQQNEDSKQSFVGDTKDQLPVLGDLQYNRAVFAGQKRGKLKKYENDKARWKEVEKQGAAVKVNDVDAWAYVKSKYEAGLQSHKFDVEDGKFLRNLIPVKQQGYLWDQYSDEDIQKAYTAVMLASEEKWKDLPLITSLNPNKNINLTYGDNIKNLRAVAESTQTRLFGDGEDRPADENYFEGDDKLRSIMAQKGELYNANASWLETYVGSETNQDKSEMDFLDYESSNFTKISEYNKAIKARRAELIQEEKDRRIAEAETKKAAEDKQNEEVRKFGGLQQNLQSLTSAENPDFEFMPQAPFIKPKSRLILQRQKDSLAMRQKLAETPVFYPDENDNLVQGPPMGEYLDWKTGAFTDKPELIKTKSEYDFWSGIGNAIVEYRKNYRVGGDLYDVLPTVHPSQAILKDIAGGTQSEQIAFRNFMNPKATDAKTSTAGAFQELFTDYPTEFANITKLSEEESKLPQKEQEKLIQGRRDALIAKLATQNGLLDGQGQQAIYNKIALALSPLAGDYYENIKGVNFYTDKYTPEQIWTASNQNGQFGLGLTSMIGAMGVDNAKELYPQLAGAKKGMDFAELKGNYQKRIQNLYKVRGDDPFEEQDLQRQRSKDKAQADAYAKQERQRLKKVENYARLNLVGQTFPEDPLEYVDFRQKQTDAFSRSVEGFGPTYPVPSDLIAFKNGGVSERWVRKLFTLKDQASNFELSQKTAEALLRYKAQFGEGTDAEQWLSKVYQLDGKIDIDDIYASTPGEGGAASAASDLSNIQTKISDVEKVVASIKGKANSKNAVARRKLENSMVDLKVAGLWNPAQGVDQNAQSLMSLSQGQFAADPLLDKLKEYGDINLSDKFRNAKAIGLATGGMVPTSVFTPRGTDTVPAMLTPGEYVVNKKAAAENRPLLESINGKRKSRNPRSSYYQDGGNVSNNGVNNVVAIDVQEISKFVTSFDRFSKELANLNIPSEITLQGTHTVDVNVNGAQVLNDLLNGPIGEMVASEVELAFQRQSNESEGAVPNPFS
jgi:TP901 family phage tail tape measure protein